jgi:hypothetical protein
LGYKKELRNKEKDEAIFNAIQHKKFLKTFLNITAFFNHVHIPKSAD